MNRTFPPPWRIAFLLGALLVCLLTTLAADANAKPMPQVVVDAPRVTLADLLPSRPELSHIDLGVAPPPGGTRLITKRHIRKVLAGLDEPVGLPDKAIPRSVRVLRKAVQLTVDRQRELVAKAVKLPKGVTLGKVRPRRAVKVAAGWTEVVAPLPRPPKRSGPWSTSITVRLKKNGALVGSFGVTVQLDVSAEAAAPDLERGKPVTLVVRHGSVEVRVRGFADRDADIGGVFPVRLRPSNKVVLARLVTRGRAVAEVAR